MALMEGNLAVKPAACPSPRPIVFYGNRPLRPTSISTGVKSDAPELGPQGFVALTPLDLLLLIVKLIIFGREPELGPQGFVALTPLDLLLLIVKLIIFGKEFRTMTFGVSWCN
jgi:hypothetical protein